MFEGFGPEKLLMLLLIVLVLFGGRRIPEIGASIGKGIREFKKGLSDVGDSINSSTEAPAPRVGTSLPTPSVAPMQQEEQRPEPKRLLS